MLYFIMVDVERRVLASKKQQNKNSKAAEHLHGTGDLLHFFCQSSLKLFKSHVWHPFRKEA